MMIRIFTLLLIAVGIIGTIISLQVDQNNSAPDGRGLLIILFFISPYLITALALKIRTSLKNSSLKAEPIILILIIVMYTLTHHDGHSYRGSNDMGIEWWAAYFAALIGIGLSIVLLLWGVFCYYRRKHNKRLQSD